MNNSNPGDPRRRQNQNSSPSGRPNGSNGRMSQRARMEAEKRRQEYMKQRRKAQKKAEFRENMHILGGRLLVFLAVLVVILIIAGVVFLIFFHSAPDAAEDSGKMDYYYGGAKARSTDIADAVSSDSVYFCFNDLADYLGFYESGNAAEMKFILSNSVEASDTAAGDGNEEIIVFYSDAWKVTINGQDVTLDIPNKLIGDEVWVSTKFIAEYMNNISIEYNEKKSEVRIARIKDEENSDDKVTVYLPVTFKLKWAAVIEPIEEDPLIGDVNYNTSNDENNSENKKDDAIDLEFATDLSNYEKYMNPTGDLRDAFLTLVNTTHTLTAEDIPNDLMDVKYTSSARKTQQLREYACKALEALYQEMQAAGYYNMAVYSGFRTYTYQDTLFNTYTSNEMANNPSLTREEAEAIVLTYSTRPGTSEHQTGLAVDMDTLGTFSTDFEYEPEYEWLQENAWKFGFILRFPKDKVDITTIQFEPWHYRFVGRYHAQKIHASGLCLEEYVEQLQ